MNSKISPAECYRTALERILAYNISIQAGMISYRPEDHIAVAEAALAIPLAAELAEQQGGALRDRTPADFAIEHAGYLSSAVKWMLEKQNDLDDLMAQREEDDDVIDDEMHAAQECVDEARDRVRSAIYEFEKRRDRALAATGKQQVGEVIPFDQFKQQYLDSLVGEVQGGALVGDEMVQAFKAALSRAQLPGKPRTYFLKDSELPSMLREVLAARQPGAQVPVRGAVLIDGTVHLVQKGEEMDWVRDRGATLLCAIDRSTCND
jgi:hypothetical protein